MSTNGNRQSTDWRLALAFALGFLVLPMLIPTFLAVPGTASAADGDATEEIQIADDGDGVRGLLYARRFTLEEPYPYLYTKEQPAITDGYILVLEVDPELAQPRQTQMPVLFVGSRPAELTNAGSESGRVIVLVPGDTNLAESPIFYGSTELPERIDQARAIRERDLALENGVQPRSAAEIEAALGAGGEPLVARHIDSVYRALADLILEYSPQESELAEIYRLIPERP